MTGPDPWTLLRRLLDDVAFAQIVKDEAHRMLLVMAADVDRITHLIYEAGAADMFTIQPCPWLPPNTMVVIDEQMMEAERREMFQSIRTMPLGGPWVTPE